MLSRVFFTSRTEEWETPTELFVKLNREFHFTLDPCATKRNAKCRRFFTKAEDGLARDWSGEKVFMNPPYGREIYHWMKKAKVEARWGGALVVALVYSKTNTRWWHDHVEGQASEVRFIRGALTFLRFGKAGDSAPFPSAIIVYRPYHLRPSV